MLRKHARFDGDIKKYKINWCTIFEDESYHKFHRIRSESFDNLLITDVTFFGYPNWRTVLTPTSPIILQDNQKNNIESIIFILNFEDFNNREKIIGFKYQDIEDFTYYKSLI